MTIDLSQIAYRLVAVMPDASQIRLDGVATNIAWEENDGELAVRLNLALRDVEMDDGSRLSAKLALCTLIYLFATWNGVENEIFRGTVWTWEHPQMNDEQITVTCYDHLYYLQKSQDNRYFAKNTKTKTVIQKILGDWKVPIGIYSASDVKHAKILYKCKTIAAMLTETLKDADEKAKVKGNQKSFIRSRLGLVDIISRGSNTDIYGFYAGQNIETSSDKYSMTELVTRVIITGKDDSNGKPKVEAKVDGLLEYGILQSIYSRGDTTLKEAKKAAQKIIDDDGKPKRTTTIGGIEFPGIRKGDIVYIETDKMAGFFFVKGAAHNATSGKMQLEVEPT